MYNRLLIMACILLQSITGFCKSGEITVSLLTLDPGHEVYTIFGHTAIRITNKSMQMDRVYNFGTFDFNDPYFYLKFIRGNLEYFLSVSDYDDFIYHAGTEQRTITEQILSLSDNEKLDLLWRLERCYNSPDRYYTYDFFFDNCATRVRDFIFNTRKSMAYDTSQYGSKTFRQLLKPFISDKYWLNLGINLALGSGADKIAKAADYMFLPKFIKEIISKTGVVESEQVLLDASALKKNRSKRSWVSPWIIVSVLLGLSMWHKTRQLALYTVTSAIGFTGMVLLVLAIISENKAFSDNLNVIWTIPSWLIVFIRKKPFSEVLKTVYAGFLMITLLLWNHLPQALSVTFFPWMLVLIIMLLFNLQWLQRSLIPRVSSFALPHAHRKN